MKNHFLSLFLLSGFLFSCSSGKTTERTLDGVMSYIQEKPDSALAVLNAIDRTALNSEKTKAKYSILYLMALDKNNVDDGAFIDLAEDASLWYSIHGTQQFKLYAEYYYADQLQDGDKMEEAVMHYTKASEMADQQGNLYYGGLANDRMAQLFHSSYDYTDQLLHARNAYDKFLAAGLTRHASFSLLDAGNAYRNMQEYKRSLEVSDSVALFAQSLKDTSLWCSALSQSVHSLLMMEPPELAKASTLLDRKRALSHKRTARDYALLAFLYAKKGLSSEANESIDSAYNAVNSQKEYQHVEYFDYEVARIQKDTARAYKALSSMTDYTIEETRSALKQSALRTVAYYNDANRKEAEIALSNTRKENIAVIMVSLSIIAFLILLFVFMRDKAKQEIESRNRELESNIDSINELKTAFEHIEAANHFTSRHSFDAFGALCEEYYTLGGDKGRRFLNAFEILVSEYRGEGFQNEFITVMDAASGGTITRLRQEMASFKANDILLFAFALSEMSYSAVSVLMGIDKPVLYNRLKRMRDRIETTNPAHAALFLKHLSPRPKYGHRPN